MRMKEYVFITEVSGQCPWRCSLFEIKDLKRIYVGVGLNFMSVLCVAEALGDCNTRLDPLQWRLYLYAWREWVDSEKANSLNNIPTFFRQDGCHAIRVHMPDDGVIKRCYTWGYIQ